MRAADYKRKINYDWSNNTAFIEDKGNFTKTISQSSTISKY